MSMLSPAEASQLLLFLSLIGRRAWLNDAGPQRNNKEFDDSGPKIHVSAFQFFYVITMSYCVFSIYTNVLTSKNVFGSLLWSNEHYEHASPQPQHVTKQLSVQHSSPAVIFLLCMVQTLSAGRAGMFQEMTRDVSGSGLSSPAPSFCAH